MTPSILSTFPRTDFLQAITKASRKIASWRFYLAFAVAEMFLLYAICFIHTLRPVTAILLTHGALHPSASCKYLEVFDSTGLIPTMLESLLVFAMVWCGLHLAPLNNISDGLERPRSSIALNLLDRREELE